MLDASLEGTYSQPVTFNNTGNSFSGNGAGLTALNASALASGSVPDGRCRITSAMIRIQAFGPEAPSGSTLIFKAGSLNTFSGSALRIDRPMTLKSMQAIVRYQ